jgi:hypothetical protein
MSYLTISGLKAGKKIRCKYPKHGTRNVLTWHEGKIDKVGVGPNGIYAVVHSKTGQYRTLRCDRMVDASLS